MDASNKLKVIVVPILCSVFLFQKFYNYFGEVDVCDSGALIVTHNTILLSPRISAHLSQGIFLSDLFLI